MIEMMKLPGGPMENATRLRAICGLNRSDRVNVDRAMALAIADQLDGLCVELDKTFKTLCETEVELSKASLLLSNYREGQR